MRILWFTNTPSLYDAGTHGYYGGGWIESLERLMKSREDVELGVSFFHTIDDKKVTKKATTYYPIKRKSSKANPLKTVLNNWQGNISKTNIEGDLHAVIQDFQPDVIQVFGTERAFAKIQEITDIPVVIHIQGIINPYLNTYFPVNQSRYNFLFSKYYFFKNIIGTSPAFTIKTFRKQAEREKKFLSQAQFVMGRTHWDKMLAQLFNPEVQYFHVDEVLRPVFYEDYKTNNSHNNDTKFRIISTLSSTVYKGIDVVLKTAKQLKELTDINYKWEIIGLDENEPLLKHFEKKEKIDHKDVDVVCRGIKSPKELIDSLQQGDVFIHTSYIDNSPNSVCEAQMVGLPVIACDVGGVSTLIKHNLNGFLVPSNGVYELTHYLRQLKRNKTLRLRLGEQAKTIANQRHDREKILDKLLSVYTKIKKQYAN